MRQAQVILIVLLTIFLSCGRSEEGEQKAWERNKAAVTTLKGKYPAFANAISEQMNLAKSAMSTAKDVSNEDDRIQKMASANAMIASGWMGDLKSMDSKIKDLQNLSLKVRGMDMEPIDQSAADASAQNVNQTINTAQSQLRQGATSIATARPLMATIKSNLERASKNLKAIKSRVEKKQKKANDSKKVAADKEADEKAKTADWKCGFCGKMNKHDLRECGGCGAAKAG